MRFTVEMPDAIAHQLHLDGVDGERRALEIFAVDGYRRGNLSRGQVSELLGLEINETMNFLKEQRAVIGQSLEDFERDARGLREYLGR